MPSRRDPETGLARRGTSNSNQRGSSYQRRRRKEWLLETYAADVEALTVRLPEWEKTKVFEVGSHHAAYFEGDPFCSPFTKREKACRCFCCGALLVYETLTVDRIIPHCKGGTYRRTNIRPACLKHNSELGGALARGKEHQAAKKAAQKKRAAKTPQQDVA